MATEQRELSGALQRHLAAVIRRLPPDELGERMADRLLAAVPEFSRATDADFRTGLVLSCSSNLGVIWQRLLDGTPVDEPVRPPPGATAWSRELVHRGLPLAVLLRAYRLGHAFAEEQIERCAAELEVPVDVRWRMLAHVSRQTFAYIDATCTQLVVDFEQEHARWIRGAAAARAELVGAIIDRRAVDPRAATDRLRYDVSRRHLALIVWTDDSNPLRRAGSLEAAAGELAAALGGGPVLTVPVGERVVWAWTSGDMTDDADSVGASVGPGVRAAVGSCARGIAGMADSHEDAREARRASELLGLRAGSVLAYRATALIALLTAAPAQAARFAESELGALAADDDASRRLRGTLRVYLEENLSPARAARRLAVHNNTVVYRVKQAEDLLGRGVEQRRLELEAALRLAERLPALRAAASRPGP